MDIGFVFGGLFLAWAFGRNNISNVFGAAVWTRMVTMPVATGIAILFVLLGCFWGSAGTSSNMSLLGQPDTLAQAFIVTLSAGIILFSMTSWGIPISIAQAMVGAVIGLSLSQKSSAHFDILKKTLFAWGISPFLGASVAFIVFKLMRLWLKHHPMKLLYKDIFTRVGLISVGAFSAYALGANNVSTISTPFVGASDWHPQWINLIICISVGIGFISADKKVMRTMGSGLFPLSPMEALIVVFSGALTLFLFSWGGLKNLLTYYDLPSFPLVPVPITIATIGAIIGVSFAKGGYGLKWTMMGRILISWILTPVLSCLLCWGLMSI